MPSTATTTWNAVSNLQSNFTVFFYIFFVYKAGFFTTRISKNDKMNHLPILVLLHTWFLQVEGILKEKLSENHEMLIESVTNTTQNQSVIIPPEDLRRLIQQYGLPLSESHFSKWVSLFCPQPYLWILTNFPYLLSRLCEPFLEGGGVNYKLFLTSLGVPEKNKGISISERSV